MAFEDIADGGARRPGAMRLQPLQESQQLLGAPGRVLAGRLENRLYEVGRRSVRAAVGSTRLLDQAGNACVAITAAPTCSRWDG